jgi:hypothetical protein
MPESQLIAAPNISRKRSLRHDEMSMVIPMALLPANSSPRSNHLQSPERNRERKVIAEVYGFGEPDPRL